MQPEISGHVNGYNDVDMAQGDITSPTKRTLRSSPTVNLALKLAPAPPSPAPPVLPLPHAPTRSSGLRQSALPLTESPVNSPAKNQLPDNVVSQQPQGLSPEAGPSIAVAPQPASNSTNSTAFSAAPSTPAPATSAQALNATNGDASPVSAPAAPDNAEPPSPPPIKRVAAHGKVLLPRHLPEKICAFCYGSASRNRHNRPEAFVSCWECGSSGHPTCLEWDDIRMVKNVKSYPWLCIECKRCEICDATGDEVSAVVIMPLNRPSHLLSSRRTSFCYVTLAIEDGTGLVSPRP